MPFAFASIAQLVAGAIAERRHDAKAHQLRAVRHDCCLVVVQRARLERQVVMERRRRARRERQRETIHAECFVAIHELRAVDREIHVTRIAPDRNERD